MVSHLYPGTERNELSKDELRIVDSRVKEFMILMQALRAAETYIQDIEDTARETAKKRRGNAASRQTPTPKDRRRGLIVE